MSRVAPGALLDAQVVVVPRSIMGVKMPWPNIVAVAMPRLHGATSVAIRSSTA